MVVVIDPVIRNEIFLPELLDISGLALKQPQTSSIRLSINAARRCMAPIKASLPPRPCPFVFSFHEKMVLTKKLFKFYCNTVLSLFWDRFLFFSCRFSGLNQKGKSEKDAQKRPKSVAKKNKELNYKNISVKFKQFLIISKK
jgi:hypothetical protein